jgi:hypothetical protein
MARIRTLKPEFWGDEKIGPLAPIHRLVFLGLVSQADDAGRLLDNVRLLDGLIFPHTEDTCSESLDVLASLSRIHRYTAASGQRCIQIEGWARHQKIDRPSKHVLPDPPTATTTRETVARHSRDPISPTLDLGPRTNDQGPRTADPRASGHLVELIAYLGEKHRHSVQTVAAMPGTGTGWARGFLGTWGPAGSMEADRIPADLRAEVVGIALQRYTTDRQNWYGPGFKPFVDRAYTDLLEHRAAQKKAEEARAAGTAVELAKMLEAAEIEKLNEEGRRRGHTPADGEAIQAQLGTGPPSRQANTGPERIAVNPTDYRQAQGSNT